MVIRFKTLVSALAMTLAIAGAASAQEVVAQQAVSQQLNTQGVGGAASAADQDTTDYYSTTTVSDPLETLNRGIFKFNEGVDFLLLKPIAKTYVFIVPEFGRDRIHNALTNLGEPVNVLNGFLQGSPERGFTSLWRFLLNSTFGVLGFFDFAAANTDLQPIQEDFGQTLGVWGWNSSTYLVLPIIGPSSTRDAIGLVGDAVSNPFNYVDNDKFVYGRLAANVVDARARNLDLVEEIYRNSVDPYATIRSAYIQRRAALVQNQKVPDVSADMR